MAEKSVELKRVVMVKAIVTEAFKQNLANELQRAIANIDAQLAQMETQGKPYLEELKKKGLMQKAAAFKHQVDEEKNRQSAARAVCGGRGAA